MEQKTIPLNKGIVRNTSLATEGELTDCVNLMPKDGQIVNTPVPTPIEIELEEGQTLLYIHPTSVGEKYILLTGTSIMEKDSQQTIYTLKADEQLYEVKHIGNVLIILTSARTYYALYDNQYTDYSFDFDNIDISFALNGEDVTLAESKEIKILKQTSKNVEYPSEAFINDSCSKKQTFDIAKPLTIGNHYKIKVSKASGESNLITYRLWYIIPIEGGTQYTEVKAGKLYSNKESYTFTCNKENVTGIRIEFGVYNYPGPNSQSQTTAGFVAVSRSADVVVWEAITNSDYKVDKDSYNYVLGLANKFTQEIALDKNRFMHPFFVRYAIELIDGSHIKPSAPCLMIPSTGIVPYIRTKDEIKGDSPSLQIFANAFVANLMYRIDSDIDSLANKTDIVKGISIAVTPPIYRYNQGADDKQIDEVMFLDSYSNIETDTTVAAYGDSLYKDTDRKALDKYYKSEPLEGQIYTHIKLPVIKDLNKQVENAGIFRVITTIPLDKLQKMETFEPVEMEEKTLAGLNGRQLLEDNTSSLSRYIAKTAFTYNDRINIANYKEHLFKGYKPTLMNGFANSVISGFYNYAADVELSVNMENKHAIVLDDTNTNTPIYWLFFPKSSAKTINLYRKVRTDKDKDSESYTLCYKTQLKLTSHPLLDGAYWFNMFASAFKGDEDLIAFEDYPQLTDTSPIITQSNKIKTSQVNNPFVMEQTTSLNDEVHALATGTKALSEGQFGQFPLYAFCADGIWALEPSADGSFQSKQPVSRDICSNYKAITQTDSSVIYPTDQGLKMLQGSTATNISRKMEGKTEDTSKFFNFSEEYKTIATADTQDFAKTLEQATMAYDYTNNLLHIYAETTAYTLNLETGDYARDDTPKPDTIVPGYPYTTIQQGTQLMQYRHNEPEATRKGILLTRETAFDEPYTLKMLRQIRFLHRHGKAKVAIWASQDRKNWKRISTNTHSYKWYRFAIITDMTNTDTLEGIILMLQRRYTHSLR